MYFTDRGTEELEKLRREEEHTSSGSASSCAPRRSKSRLRGVVPRDDFRDAAREPGVLMGSTALCSVPDQPRRQSTRYDGHRTTCGPSTAAPHDSSVPAKDTYAYPACTSNNLEGAAEGTKTLAGRQNEAEDP